MRTGRAARGRGGPAALAGLVAGAPFAFAPWRVEPSCKEEWTLSDPGPLGSEAHRPAQFAGRESYDPGRGRSGYFRPVSGLAPGIFEISGKCAFEWDL